MYEKIRNVIVFVALVVLITIILPYLKYAIIAIIAIAIVTFLVKYAGRVRLGGAPGGAGRGHRPHLGKYIKALIYLVVILAALYFLWPYLMGIAVPEKSKGPLNSVIYLESQDGAGLAVNNGTYGIQLATGSAKTGTTFLLRTVKEETGWPAFGADAYCLRGNATLKVSYIDMDSPAKSIRFKEVLIPAGYSFRYSNKYKLSDYRAWTANGTSQNEIEKVFLAYRKDPPRHDIEIEVYVPPNSYVELSNVAIVRNW